jgi:hypothetical protein
MFKGIQHADDPSIESVLVSSPKIGMSPNVWNASQATPCGSSAHCLFV